MKKALVLGGGGTKGAYQYGAIRALEKLNLLSRNGADKNGFWIVHL